jgi:hypothetical protein
MREGHIAGELGGGLGADPITQESIMAIATSAAKDAARAPSLYTHPDSNIGRAAP